MGFAGWLVERFLPGRSPDDSDLDAAFEAANVAQRKTAQSAIGATASVEQHRRGVEAERVRIQARTANAVGKRHRGQTSTVALAVEDALKLRSFGGHGSDEG